MFCGRKSNAAASSAQKPIPLPKGLARTAEEAKVNSAAFKSNSAVQVDLRAEKDEPALNSYKVMDYLETQVVTKENGVRWLPRLFVLNDSSLCCFYESAPHL
jgi:hypothetical protein